MLFLFALVPLETPFLVSLLNRWAFLAGMVFSFYIVPFRGSNNVR